MTVILLGCVVGTPTALNVIAAAGIMPHSLLFRHMHGDWGDVCKEDAQLNDQAVGEDLRILSSYHLAAGTVWILTEADRSSTTILLPDEY